MNPRKTYHHGDLRAALVAHARVLVAEKGVAGLSVAEAARRAGVSGAAPYRHFAGRLDLLSAAATDAGRELRERMQAAVGRTPSSRGQEFPGRGQDDVADPAEGWSDAVAGAVEDLAALAEVHVRFQQEHGAAFELIFADELHDVPDQRRREVTRSMFDVLLSPALVITGDVRAANLLLRSFSAVVTGFALMSRGGGRGYPTDLRGFASEVDLVADEAARAVRTLARAAAEPRRDEPSSAGDR